MPRPPYDASLKPVARRLRKRMTKSERRLWSKLRRKQIHGYTFNRQFIILNYIVDFYCRPLRIAVEVDGITHDDPEVARNDIKRQQALEALGIRVVRFPSGEVMNDIDNVVQAIEGCVLEIEAQREL
ncbi:MAG: endonuclease domain-containing protein [Longimonas sp.]|uniref:endonuclease domain-containing protein n=1 Tax=Longimonas sp. TaxID=2039626 RepID=UPI0033592334